MVIATDPNLNKSLKLKRTLEQKTKRRAKKKLKTSKSRKKNLTEKHKKRKNPKMNHQKRYLKWYFTFRKTFSLLYNNVQYYNYRKSWVTIRQRAKFAQLNQTKSRLLDSWIYLQTAFTTSLMVWPSGLPLLQVLKVCKNLQVKLWTKKGTWFAS